MGTVRWDRASRGGAPDPQERKYRLRESANGQRRALARKGYKNATVTICEDNGLHEIWD